ncbi:carbohydrate ABC transporter permease [Vibrio gazogenes]|uniref:Carbohydrate ABC transporter membrane protein 2, CUT1 family (TC 3.A.1.1.-) n=1 Tax=Vibrio gazogenes DSM 21264 = NBRC 103151 TaxID=1123492 RepID=A0A1M5G2C1_VIBGA|nr:carbohydrate ABC transporter permease [Vibrio gazogenes]USP14734.1 carbohydrate ABC transporter permease [Vibrio gazogenes]SHF97562.1 carbohydrate ABC transporter membrane protein 2, CUT1 family (TC 3.A.1.1.-) [Vibrio gazogenes DSM 21264] [Vibrio gazogenes DSM 21264 = NBRC 103151]SJN59113.1 L-arabinose transport system permease protein AraQ [Vibrio gazogenes]
MTTQVMDANPRSKTAATHAQSETTRIARSSLLAWLKHLFLITCGTIMVFPFLWMLSGSLKSNDEIFASPLNLIPEKFHWQTFIETFQSAPFGLYIFNSFTVALFTTLLVIINSAMFAYALTQLKFRSKTVIYFVVMGCYMLPGAVTYIPSYITLAKLDLLDSHMGLIVSNAASIFGVFYLRQVFIKIHPSLIEAARIDGAGELKILWAILLPQCKAAVATLFLITFITNYNSYMWPSLVITTPELNLIATGIRHYFIAEGNYGLNWSQIMAASTIAVLPLSILFIICQKTILSGIADNGVKE